MENPGQRIIDISEVVERFEAQEGEVEHIIGKTGQGKTYEGTRRAAQYLFSGYTVYTTWRLHLPDYYDEREHFWPVVRNFILFRKEFFRFDLKNNWHYVNLRDYEDKDGVFDTEKFSRFLASLTDAIFFLDEGQDVFDSHTKAGKIARQTITRTRHMHKTLIILSQRAQAVDVTARGNVTNFYRCEKRYIPFFGYRFRVYRTDEIDDSSAYPIWVRHDSTGRKTWEAELWHSAFAKKWIYDMYDSWYMRQEQIRSQDIKLEAYTLTLRDRLSTLFSLFRKKRRLKPYKELTRDEIEGLTHKKRDTMRAWDFGQLAHRGQVGGKDRAEKAAALYSPAELDERNILANVRGKAGSTLKEPARSDKRYVERKQSPPQLKYTGVPLDLTRAKKSAPARQEIGA